MNNWHKFKNGENEFKIYCHSWHNCSNTKKSNYTSGRLNTHTSSKEISSGGSEYKGLILFFLYLKDIGIGIVEFNFYTRKNLPFVFDSAMLWCGKYYFPATVIHSVFLTVNYISSNKHQPYMSVMGVWCGHGSNQQTCQTSCFWLQTRKSHLHTSIIDATMFNWIRFSWWFEMSSDKLQNVSQSVSQCEQSWDSLSNYC